MVSFTQDGTKVRVEVDPAGSGGAHLYLYWECNRDILAELLAQRLQELLEHRLESIRRDAYSQGWKDRASKKKKMSWFACSF